MMIVMMGSFALHGTNVVVMAVMRLVCSSSMVLEPMMAGTPHPIPMTTGITVLPESPKRQNRRSRRYATLDMYPHSSSMDRQRNSTMICGRNPRTANTPAMIPSTMRPVRAVDTLASVRASLTVSCSHAVALSLIQSEPQVPTVCMDM